MNSETLAPHGLKLDFLSLNCLNPDLFGPHGLNLDFLWFTLFKSELIRFTWSKTGFLQSQQTENAFWLTHSEHSIIWSQCSEPTHFRYTRSEHKTPITNQYDTVAHKLDKKENK